MTELLRHDGTGSTEALKPYEDITLHFSYYYKGCMHYSNSAQTLSVVFGSLDYRDEFSAVETIGANTWHEFRIYDTGGNHVA